LSYSHRRRACTDNDYSNCGGTAALWSAYGLPTPMYWNPMARRRDESSRFLVSMMIGRLTRWRIFAKSSVRNSGQPVATIRASTPSQAP